MKHFLMISILTLTVNVFAKSTPPTNKEEPKDRKPDAALTPATIANGFLRLADALAQARLANMTCDVYAYPDKIIQLFNDAKVIVNEIQPTASMEKALHDNLGYRLAKADKSVFDIAQDANLLIGTKYYGGQSAITPIVLEIKEKNIATLSETNYTDDGQLKTITTEGSWTVKGPDDKKHQYTTLIVKMKGKTKTYAINYTSNLIALTKSSTYKIIKNREQPNLVDFWASGFDCGD